MNSGEFHNALRLAALILWVLCCGAVAWLVLTWA